MITRKVAYELGPYGITCNAIALSRTLSERINPRWEALSEAEQQAHLQRTPCGVWPCPKIKPG